MLYQLATFPLFLRFDKVSISYNYVNDQTIEEKCELIEKQLLPLKLGLNDSNTIEFVARISRNDQNDRNNFSDHLKLLDYIRNRFLPICNSSRCYKFQIWFFSDANSGTEIITSILEMDEIKHCSNVEIRLFYGGQKRLPVKVISTWLERSADGAKNNHQNQKERFLKIWYHYYSSPYIQTPSFNSSPFIQNAREMLEHLAKVYFIYFMAD